MKNLFILLCVAMICISATVMTTTINQPATPKSVMHKVLFDDDDADQFITECVKRGYIIKTVACSQSQDSKAIIIRHTYVIIAEKY